MWWRSLVVLIADVVIVVVCVLPVVSQALGYTPHEARHAFAPFAVVKISIVMIPLIAINAVFVRRMLRTLRARRAALEQFD